MTEENQITEQEQRALELAQRDADRAVKLARQIAEVHKRKAAVVRHAHVWGVKISNGEFPKESCLKTGRAAEAYANALKKLRDMEALFGAKKTYF